MYGEQRVPIPKQRQVGDQRPDFSVLTGREAEVLLLLSTGDTNRVLARDLGISERTVRAHLTSIRRKLGLRSRIEIALVSHQHREFLSSVPELPDAAMPQETVAGSRG
jgi:two-component system nitrate/nitrite response regulator NarL